MTKNDWISSLDILIFNMVIGIHGKDFKKRRALVKRVFQLLDQHHATILVSQEFENILKKARWHEKYPNYTSETVKDLDFLFSLGGDGTFLESLTHIGKLQIPIMGINIGRLGYLATISKDNLVEAVRAVFEDNYELDNRILLSLTGQGDLFDGIDYALNDFTISKKDTSSMIVVKVFIDGKFLNGYWADGLIVATPTGSTGYSLSCGGPMVMPHSNNFVLTPVAPHNLTTRPVVISAKSELSFEIEGRAKNVLVTMDSRSRSISKSAQLVIRKERFKARLVKIKGYNNFDTLRQKLNWGLDVRNY